MSFFSAFFTNRSSSTIFKSFRFVVCGPIGLTLSLPCQRPNPWMSLLWAYLWPTLGLPWAYLANEQILGYHCSGPTLGLARQPANPWISLLWTYWAYLGPTLLTSTACDIIAPCLLGLPWAYLCQPAYSLETNCTTTVIRDGKSKNPFFVALCSGNHIYIYIHTHTLYHIYIYIYTVMVLYKNTARVLPDLVGALFLYCLGPLKGMNGRVVWRGCKCWSCAQWGIKGPSDLVFGGSEVGPSHVEWVCPSHLRHAAATHRVALCVCIYVYMHSICSHIHRHISTHICVYICISNI